MQLRRAALPLSLLALLATAGCVSVGPESSPPGPGRGSVPPVDAADAAADRDASDTPPTLPLSRALPLGPLPARTDEPARATDADATSDTDTGRAPARAARPTAAPARPAAPRRVRPPQAASPHLPRRSAPRAPRGDELCAAAEGAVPPSIVDLCVRQYGR
ncbi:hypothetical protein OG906_30310 [Streptomyces sp. NBC_01426]|uniref:hypothetical protein n=1 Tax=Streptomyces sp. NBC_01426 TaxID=2975866 RepID=UPI002E357F9A|nr:hypothetical protein [Streptomyces sp. NBC_01426]